MGGRTKNWQALPPGGQKGLRNFCPEPFLQNSNNLNTTLLIHLPPVKNNLNSAKTLNISKNVMPPISFIQIILNGGLGKNWRGGQKRVEEFAFTSRAFLPNLNNLNSMAFKLFKLFKIVE